jgi:group I intron endonuclease
MKSGIYSITNLVNNKIYIGSAVDIKKRWRDHRFCFKRQIHHNSHFQSAWNLYGESNFKFEVIEFCDKTILLDREKYFVELYNSTNSLFGYNFNDPRKRFEGHKTTDELKELFSAKMKGSNNPMYGKKGVNHPKFGYELSETSKKQLGEKRKEFIGEKASNVKLTNQQVMEIRSKYIPRVYSTTKLAKEYNVSQGTIMNIVNKHGWTHM